MSEQSNALKNNAYKNMLVAVSNSAFIQLTPESEWMRINVVDGTIDVAEPGEVKVHLLNENEIGDQWETISISDINPATVSFLKLQKYSLSGVLMSVMADPIKSKVY